MRKEHKLRLFLIIFSVVCLFAVCQSGLAAEPKVIKLQDLEVAGEFFDIPVSIDNYYFAKSAIMIFGTRWGAQPKTPEELEEKVWDDLLLSFEAYRREITIDEDKVDEEVAKTLKAEKVEFDWKQDKEAFDAWTKERTGANGTTFVNLIRHLLQIQETRQAIIDNFDPEVTEEDAYDEFLNEYNTLSVEFVQFEDLKEAETFYKKNKKAQGWEKYKKKDPKFTTKPGFVSLECLIDLWKIPKEDAYAMLDLEVDSVYKPTPIYRGYGVFRTIEKRVAKQEDFPIRRESYFKQVRRIKQYEAYNEWFKEYKENANIKKFVGASVMNKDVGEE